MLTVDQMIVQAFRPSGYDVGAYRISIELLPDEQRVANLAPPVSFALPKLQNRLVVADRGFDAAVVIDGQIQLRGVFQPNTGWFGHCYTNGVTEAVNPTPIKDVEDAVQLSAEAALDAMRAWAKL